MHDKADILALVCQAIESTSSSDAAHLLTSNYPFNPTPPNKRNYTPSQCMEAFTRDGFIDRYSGKKLVFPGTLRLLSKLLPEALPFHPNWKTDCCHFAYYELFPTIDHKVPVTRGGADHIDNWVTTSMLRNSAKANFTIEELEWTLHPPGALDAWDGLTQWFIDQAQVRPEIQSDPYLAKWLKAARAPQPKSLAGPA